MNTCATLSHRFGSIRALRLPNKPGFSICLKGIVLFCCWGFPLLSFAESDLQQQLLPLFITLESSDSDAGSVDLAIRQIVKLGPKTLPLLKKRLNQTGNYRYLYLIEKLGNSVQSFHTWSEKDYFRKRYLEAEKYLQKGKIERAQAIAKAILVLEPNISFRLPLRDFILRCEDAKFAQQVVIGQISTDRMFYSPGKPIRLHLLLENRKSVPVTLDSRHSGIVLHVKKREFAIDGGYREQNTTRTIPLEREIRLKPQETQKTEVSLPNPKMLAPAHRVYIVTAKIPRCKVSYSARQSHPNILFTELTVTSFPSDYHQVARRSLKTCESALSLGYPEHLFFASFFLDGDERAQLIPELIDYLGGEMEPVVLGILQRLTGKNFTNKNSWQTWWYAHESEWGKKSKQGRKKERLF